jgi:hypothetical protein
MTASGAALVEALWAAGHRRDLMSLVSNMVHDRRDSSRMNEGGALDLLEQS